LNIDGGGGGGGDGAAAVHMPHTTSHYALAA